MSGQETDKGQHDTYKRSTLATSISSRNEKLSPEPQHAIHCNVKYASMQAVFDKDNLCLRNITLVFKLQFKQALPFSQSTSNSPSIILSPYQTNHLSASSRQLVRVLGLSLLLLSTRLSYLRRRSYGGQLSWHASLVARLSFLSFRVSWAFLSCQLLS